MKILQRPPFLPVRWDLEGEYVEKNGAKYVVLA